MPKTLKSKKKPFDKYHYYTESVQSPDVDAKFLRKVYAELRSLDPLILREDFCGTFALCEEWVKLSPDHTAYGLDLDMEPLLYGQARVQGKPSSFRQRLHTMQMNVLDELAPHADVVAALNFSYFIFRERFQLLNYFRRVHSSLQKNGVFVVDAFGGSACQEKNEEITRHKGFKYFWDQKSFDPVTAQAQFAIHFQVGKGIKRRNVFTYDWRMWTLPEIRELMLEAGFKTTHVYWEGTTKNGGGNGRFRRVQKGEECLAWVAYIAGEV